jgi:RNA polymerase sigma-70 factor (family 1)
VEIVRLISEGDEHAFETFVTHYGPDVQQAILQVVRTEIPVKDIMQDVFLNIWITREKLREIRDPRTWLFRITYYRSYTWLRQQNIKTKVHETLSDRGEEGNPVEENSAFEETRKFLHEAIAMLPQQTRKIYQMSREQNKSIAEIADELNVAPQTVKNTMTNALKSIRNHLEQKGIIIPFVILTLSFH